MYYNTGRFEMKKTTVILSILVYFLCSAGLIMINRDLYHFEYSFPFSRTFTPDENTKGNYLMTDPIPLKAGSYTLRFPGRADTKGNECYLLNAGDEMFFSAPIPSGEFTAEYETAIEKNTAVRVGFSYDPDNGILEIGSITLESSHVLYKESILRHALLSFLLIFAAAYIELRLLKTDLPEWFQEKTGHDLIHIERVFLFLLFLTVLSFWPYFDPARFTEGDDFFFHASRIHALAKTLKAGYFPARIYLGWMYDYGIGCGFYYPDIILCIPAILILFGFSIITSIKVFFFICTFFSVLTMFIAAKKIGNNSDFCGAAAASLYAFAAYRLICVFYRNAVGEVQAFIFFPLIIMSLYEILKGKTERWPLFAFGFMGLMMSHMISLATAGVLCALLLLFSIRKLFRNKRILPALLKAAVFTILVGAFFLLPMLEQAANNELQINVFMRSNGRILPYNLTAFSSIFHPYDFWHWTPEKGQNVYPGWSMLLVPILRLILFIRKKKSPLFPAADRMLALGVLTLYAATDAFPWALFKWLLLHIQFSWRFLAAGSASLCIAGSIYFSELLTGIPSLKRKVLVVLFIAMLSGMPTIIITFCEKMVPNEQLILLNKQVSGAEYIPPNFDIEFADKNRDTVLPDDPGAEITYRKRKGLEFSFSFEKESNSAETSYMVPMVYFYGYEADLTAPDGTVSPIPVTRDPIGLVRVSDTGLREGSVHIIYRKTPLQKTCELISAVSLVLFLAVVVINKGRNNSATKYRQGLH